MRTEPVLDEGVWNTPLGKETIWKHLDLRPPSPTKKFVRRSGALENGRTWVEQVPSEDIHASDSCPVLRSLRKRYFKILTAE